MHLFSLMLGAILSTSPLTQTEKAEIDRAVTAMSRCSYGGKHLERSRRQFEQQAPRSQVPHWEAMRRRLGLFDRQYMELSALLACYGVDYSANLGRILRPYRTLQRVADNEVGYQIAFRGKTIDGRTLDDRFDDTPGILACIFAMRHDAMSVGLLLDLNLDGGPAEHRDEALMNLWPTDKISILRSVSGSPERTAATAHFLQWLFGDTSGPGSGRARTSKLLGELSTLSRSRDARVAAGSRQVSLELQRLARREKQGR